MPKLSHTVMVKNPNTGVESEVVIEGLASFFQLSILTRILSHTLRTNFALMQHHKYSLTEIENMIPWETRNLYCSLLEQYIEEEKSKGTTTEWHSVVKFYGTKDREGEYIFLCLLVHQKFLSATPKLRVNRINFEIEE